MHLTERLEDLLFDGSFGLTITESDGSPPWSLASLTDLPSPPLGARRLLAR